MRWTVEEAIRAARALQPYDPTWLEEPIIPDDIAGHARIMAAGGVPIAAGENLRSLWEFKNYIAAGGVSYPEPDVTNCGGVTVFMKIARLAEAFNLPVTSHGAHDITVHLLAACPNRSYLEAHGFGLDRYIEHPLVLEQGMALAPTRPGHGITFDWSGLAQVASSSVCRNFPATMMEHRMRTTRRTFVRASLATAAAALLPISLHAQEGPPARRPIPSTREAMPVVGLGTWITFNVGDDPVLRDECAGVMAAFFEAGGRMIDSSPMYGSSQPVIGYGLQKLGRPSALFSAEKVWTSSAAAGPAQIEQSRRFWGVPKFDLVQVHNLLAWKAHLQTLFEMKAAGAVRYVGITTSEGRRHDLLEQIMRSEPIDFVQFSYNVVDREAEERLLPLASERGIAVIVNRPFRQGALTQRLKASRCPNGRPRSARRAGRSSS